MRRLLAAASLSAVASLSVAAQAADLPKSVQAQLPAGYRTLAAVAGPDLDQGRHSYLVVLHRAVDTMSDPSPRPLLIFEQQADGTYRLAARNDHVVLQANEGGQCDPFDPDEAGEDGFAVKGHYFTVQHFVACGQHWTDFVTFRYDPRTREWLFSSDIFTASFPLDDRPDEVDATRADPRKPVPFSQWRRKN
ncbi:hypothetical protein ACV229_29765 [Burkholderia sp. MR1-5-21]